VGEGSFDAEVFNPREANQRLAGRAAAKRAPVWGRMPEKYRDAPLQEPAVWQGVERIRHMATARDLLLRRDLVAFLGCLRDHKLTCTTARGNLPLAVVQVAATFVELPPVEWRLGSSVFPVRNEQEVSRVYFVHLLANPAALIHGGPGQH
jgi:hypothetical protein